MGRNTLLKMYETFSRPLLEHASVIWDESSGFDSLQLENVQILAAKIVSDLLILEPLSNRHGHQFKSFN